MKKKKEQKIALDNKQTISQKGNIVYKAFRTLICLILIGCGVFGGYIVGDLVIGQIDTFDPSAYTASAYKEKESDIKAWEKKSITELSATQIFVVAQYKIENCGTYCVYTKGYDGGDKGKVTTLGMTQDLYGYRYINGTKGYFDYFSTGIANVAKKTEYTVGEDKYYSFEGSLSGSEVTWSPYKTDAGLKYRTKAEYEEMAGVNPDSPIDYIVSRKTVVSEKNNGQVDGMYSFTLNLNVTTSVLNYVKKMKYMSGFDYPKFTNVELRFEVDKDMNFQNIYINESYKVIGMSAVGKYKNEFHYNLDEIMEK